LTGFFLPETARFSGKNAPFFWFSAYPGGDFRQRSAETGSAFSGLITTSRSGNNYRLTP
jgi:hypothetical protein